VDITIPVGGFRTAPNKMKLFKVETERKSAIKRNNTMYYIGIFIVFCSYNFVLPEIYVRMNITVTVVKN
jgi:hypothetical protein